MQRQWQREYFRDFPGGEAPPGVRLVVFSVSTFGAFGPDALALLRTLSRLSGRTVPPSLLEEASWAAPVFASFARMWHVPQPLHAPLACVPLARGGGFRVGRPRAREAAYSGPRGSGPRV